MKAKYSNFKNKSKRKVSIIMRNLKGRDLVKLKKMNCSYKTIFRGIETILDGVHVFHIYLVSFFKKILLTNITSC